MSFVKVLEEIRKQSGYNFMYNEKFTRNVGRITLEVKIYLWNSDGKGVGREQD